MYLIGIDPTKVRTETEGAEFAKGTLGYVVTSDGPKAYTYVEFNNSGTFTEGVVCMVDSTHKAYAVTDTLSAPGTGQGNRLATVPAGVTHTASGFGWVQVYGKCKVRVLANCAANTQLTTSATAGAVDDATTAGLEVCNDLITTAANGGSTAVVDGFATNPVIGRTL